MSRLIGKDFLWGASTAAHQVEGNTHNQWSEWEQVHAERLARTAGRRLRWLPNWSDIKTEAETPENYLSGWGDNHYERYKEDFTLLKDLNMNAFRFSIEWSRIEPEEGKWDEKEIEHYQRYFTELKQLGIEPVVTLWHWTEPVWFARKGGFAKRANVRYFERFAAKIAAEYGDMFRYVMPLNEPNNYALIGYLLAEWPPMKRDPIAMLRVYCNLVTAHRRACAALKEAKPECSVGIAMHVMDMLPANPHNLLNRLLTATGLYAWNLWFIDRIRSQLDFVGVNFYQTEYYNWAGKAVSPKAPVNDLGWYMEPKGLQRMLLQLWRRYRLPLIITENGVADGTDKYRQWWLEQTLKAMKGALSEGVNLKGYLHWSLLDNFEWAFGWWPKFGLVAVDRKTMKRTIRPSARWFAEQIASMRQAKG